MTNQPCPKCGFQNAYIGFSSVECRNPECVHYTVQPEPLEAPRVETPQPPGWSHWLSKAHDWTEDPVQVKIQKKFVEAQIEQAKHEENGVNGHWTMADGVTRKIINGVVCNDDGTPYTAAVALTPEEARRVHSARHAIEHGNRIFHAQVVAEIGKNLNDAMTPTVTGQRSKECIESKRRVPQYDKAVKIGPNTSPIMAMIEDMRKLTPEEVAALPKYYHDEPDYDEPDCAPQEYVMQIFRTAKE